MRILHLIFASPIIHILTTSNAFLYSMLARWHSILARVVWHPSSSYLFEKKYDKIHSMLNQF